MQHILKGELVMSLSTLCGLAVVEADPVPRRCGVCGGVEWAALGPPLFASAG